MKKFFVLMMMAFCMVFSASAVGTNTSKRVLAKSLKIEKSGDVTTVKKDGQNYTGIFWSNDAKTIQYKAENGKIVRTIVFYPNQKNCTIKDCDKTTNYLRSGQAVGKLTSKDTEYSKKCVKDQGI